MLGQGCLHVAAEFGLDGLMVCGQMVVSSSGDDHIAGHDTGVVICNPSGVLLYSGFSVCGKIWDDRCLSMQSIKA